MELRNDFERFNTADAQIVAIGQGSAARAKQFRAELELPFPILADPRRTAYRAYSLLSMDIRREASFTGLVRGVKAAAQYGMARSPDQDMLQLGGVFVIGTDGGLRFAHRAQRVSDNPPHEAILAALS